MALLLAATQVEFSTSEFVPLALGFFGLGTGYLIYGPEELFKLPSRSRAVDLTTGLWGIWMPGFLQFVTGIYLFAGLAWFHSFREKPLYMAAVAFTAYGVHWWAIGMARALGGDPRPNGFMSIAFTVLSALGVTVFFKADDVPVALLFVGLTCVYVADFFASLFQREPAAVATGSPAAKPVPTALSELGERALGLFHIVTGCWLMYLTWAVTLNTTVGTHLWV
jgi:hypothetical protein